jgi:uncharacterized protein YqjF (DUF2071 family)
MGSVATSPGSSHSADALHNGAMDEAGKGTNGCLQMLERGAGIAVGVENFILITHSVPAARVRRHLPDLYELETFAAADGSERALVSATCFCNRNFRPYALAYPRLTFNESTYRTYVRLRGRVGVYFFGRYLGDPVALAAQRLFARDTYLGDFDVSIAAAEKGYPSYSCSVASARGATRFAARALDRPTARPPFHSGHDLAQFITYRLHGFFTSSLGHQGHMPVSHKRMSPLAGALLEDPRLDLWEQLGIVSPEEASQPYSILVQPPLDFVLLPPRLAR